MYTEGSQTTGHHRFLHNTHTPCSCQPCIYHEQPNKYQRGSGSHPASARQTDHSSADCWRDIQAPRVKDAGGRAFLVDRVERSGHLSPQRRPVFAGPGLHSHSDDLNQVCPWELNPAQWSDPTEPGVRCYSSVKEQCGCVMHGNRTHPVHSGIPHPLPHLQVKGQGYRREKIVRYISVDDEEGCRCTLDSYHLEPHINSPPGYFPMTNGHCGPRGVVFEEEEEGDDYQDQGKLKGGSEDDLNHCSGSDKSFFSTEVPQKHLSRTRRKESCIPLSNNTCSETSKSTTSSEHQHQGSKVTTQGRKQDTVRDQIRQVVTNLEEVLGGLKQVHVEMKEVVEQIDRLTANIDLSKEEAACITNGSTNDVHDWSWSHQGDFRVAPFVYHNPASFKGSQLAEEGRIILRTNSVSPVHMASVVKTSRVTPSGLHNDVNHKKPSVNGHPPHLCSTGEPDHTSYIRPRTLDPKVIIGNSTSSSRTQKPPPYPQNGRCGKGQNLPHKPVRTPAYPVRGRQSTSMV
uniref:Protein Largen n=1 Tax=Nothobranchius kadleci TaxID=1051664 RepID=A0A1A8CS88_NOTKA